MKLFKLILIALVTLAFFGCKKDKDPDPVKEEPKLIFKFQFDSTQVRLNNFGNVSTIPSTNSAQSPVFNKMSAHYIELAPTKNTALGQGTVIYKNEETTLGGTRAIDFSKAIIKGNGEIFFSIPLKDIPKGNYEWLRVSLAYQNYDIKYKSDIYYGSGTLASFIGYNTFITSYNIKNQPVQVNENKPQGFWGFETTAYGTTYTSIGQAPPGATTVPNPIASTSPIPAGSCVVTGEFINPQGQTVPLQLLAMTNKDIVITVSLSTNKSFEWKDANMDGWFEPAAGDTVVDMGIRGLIPFIN
ncbi:MAG: hypothetical protein H0V01_11225 [Bacteroidetes bacterium]|nr:hypothetical protein [Bacteroidota bacterium]HET6243337.1 hypothetical protein [Bacteroidia bacterium]